MRFLSLDTRFIKLNLYAKVVLRSFGSKNKQYFLFKNNLVAKFVILSEVKYLDIRKLCK